MNLECLVLVFFPANSPWRFIVSLWVILSIDLVFVNLYCLSNSWEWIVLSLLNEGINFNQVNYNLSSLIIEEFERQCRLTKTKSIDIITKSSTWYWGKTKT